MFRTFRFISKHFDSIVFFALLLLFAVFSKSSLAEQVRIDDIRIEGLQRVSASSVFAVLPVKVGDKIDSDSLAVAARSIFNTGNFQDIKVLLQSNVLIFLLQERPSVSEINIDGNKAIETDALLDSLNGAGMAEGRVFQRATIEGMKKELLRQYGAQGRYDAAVDVDITAQPRNRVAVDVTIDEGSVAKVKQINIIGNEIFKDSELRDLFEQKDRGWFTFISGKNKYARERLAGDLETLRSHYLDQGYIQFSIVSTQVAVTPQKDAVYITINVDEGEPYDIENIELSGEIKLQQERLRKLVLLKPGDRFSQQRITATEELISKVLGNEGFAFAEVKGIAKPNVETKKVDLTFFVDPGKRTYVRHIEFNGNEKTRDEVLRREMRQMEGAIASTSQIEHSRVRLERLGFFKDVKVETPKVPGRDDMIDVVYSVEEQPSGSVSASIGVSQDVGVVFATDLQLNNFMGTGNQVSIGANRSRYITSYAFSYLNPYFTKDGVSRGFNLFFRETDFDEVNITSFSTNSWGGSVIFGYPISDISALRFSGGYTKTEIETGVAVVQEIKGTPEPFTGSLSAITQADLDAYSQVLTAFLATCTTDTSDPPVTTCTDPIPSLSGEVVSGAYAFPDTPEGFVDENGDNFGVFLLSTQWSQSTLNRGILATRGYSQRLGLEMSVPGSELEYFKLSYNGQFFKPITKNFTLRLRGEIGYGDGYGDTDGLPFFEHFFAGGFGSVRGFESNTLGPRSTPARQLSARIVELHTNNDGVPDSFQSLFLLDSNGVVSTQPLDTPDPFGGNILFEGSVEMLFPMPFVKDQRSLRSAFFFDFGNVFDDSCGVTQVNCSNFDFSELRYSYGVGVTWITGFGPLSFSFGVPLNESSFDERESFQFSIGRGF